LTTFDDPSVALVLGYVCSLDNVGAPIGEMTQQYVQFAYHYVIFGFDLSEIYLLVRKDSNDSLPDVYEHLCVHLRADTSPMFDH